MEFYKPIKGESIADIIGRRRELMKSRSGLAAVIDLFVLHFEHTPNYLPEASPVSLLALISLKQEGARFTLETALLPATKEHISALENVDPDLEWLKAYAAIHQTPWLMLSAPLLLEPVYISKPWGQEIWYTGIEARGQSRVTDGCFSVPLPWVMELIPQEHPLTLLKILDPLPDENLGNLYFELHEQKQEVYIVTHVDSAVWPDGVGKIQMGFCQQKRKEFASDAEFKKAYLQVVSEYRQVRKTIDLVIDQLQKSSDRERGILYQEFSAADANKALVIREQELRNSMNAFIYHHPLRVGDVVKVPCHTPHSLQYGVRVVEFQTPVYERKILSFSQKVVTQDEWDTEEAMGTACLDAANLEVPELLSSSSAYQLERIVNFDDFQVQRLIVNESLNTALKIETAILIMLIKGEGSFSLDKADKASQAITPGQAYLINPAADGLDLLLEAGSILLVAMPKNLNWADLA